MNYHVYAVGEPFEKNNVYHQVDATSPKKAACVFALNEESLYGICDNNYNVYDDNGKMITRIDVSDRNAYINIKTNEPEEPCGDPFSTIEGDSIPYTGNDGSSFDLGNGLSLEGGTFYDLGSGVIGVGPEDPSMYGNDNDSVNITNDIISLLAEFIKPNLDEKDRAYNPLIAREFLRSANFSEQFVNRYGFFIGESDVGVLGEDNHKLHLIITGKTKEANWPTTFSNAEYDQLHNIGAVLLACGIVFFEISENIWQLYSKRWNFAQIATITRLVMSKCKLHRTGMHSADADNDHLWEYKGREDLPNALGFLA